MRITSSPAPTTASACPRTFDAVHAAPLLCAGLIGYRALAMAGDAARLAIYGFGAAAHLVAQVAVWQKREVYAFTKPGDARGSGVRALARLCVGRRFRRGATGAVRRGADLRAGRSARPGCIATHAQGRDRGLRRHPYEHDPGVSLRHPVGRARRALRRQPHAPRRRGVSRARRASAGAHHRRSVPAAQTPTPRSTPCAAVACAVPQCSTAVRPPDDSSPASRLAARADRIPGKRSWICSISFNGRPWS